MPFEPTREGQLTEKGLGFGYWWVTHKVQLRQILTVALGVVAAPLLAYGIWGFVDWFFVSGVAERAAMAELARPAIDYAYFREQNAPRDLRLEAPLVLASGDKTYDITARIQNPNTRWWVEFDYGSGAGPLRHAFLLPGESRQVSILGMKSDARPSSSPLALENLQWHRVDLHETRPDYESWASARLGMRVEDAAFMPPQPTDVVPVWRANFTAVNDTAFGYYDLRFVVTLISGSRIVGVNEVTVSELRPGERRAVTASWYAELPTVTKIDVKAVVNIFDAQSYIPTGR